jgi:FtsP/CotA-like multicopper oxidase with cupredoxin domain
MWKMIVPDLPYSGVCTALVERSGDAGVRNETVTTSVPRNAHVDAWLAVALVACSLGFGGCDSRHAGLSADTKTAAVTQGTTRIYYIAADDVEWDYAPSGKNLITGGPFEGDAAFFATPSPMGLGRVYKKTVYREYTDDTFRTLKPRAPEWEHLGLLGPLIRAEVGDTIKVVFRNNGTRPYSVHPHGVFYEKASEGAQYDDGAGQKSTALPGATHTYTWPVPERAGPSHGEGSSIVWMYHSHVEEEKDVNAGLIGPLLVTARGQARPDGSPKDVDREIVAGFMEMDENNSWHFDDNVKKYGVKDTKVKFMDNFADPIYIGNLKENINGFIYGNTPAIVMRKDERVRWYLFASTNFEIHAPHWHGNTVVARHMRTDVTSLLPMDMVVADMQPDNPGTWLFHCHVGPHLRAGMVTKYTVQESSASPGGARKQP